MPRLVTGTSRCLPRFLWCPLVIIAVTQCLPRNCVDAQTHGTDEASVKDMDVVHSAASVPADASSVEDPAAFAAMNTRLMLASVTIFGLAIFLGVELISKVPPTLHTPLMSGSNAISGITLVGALIATSAASWNVATYFGWFAIVFATVNVVGGFLVTHRMLAMFRKR